MQVLHPLAVTIDQSRLESHLREFIESRFLVVFSCLHSMYAGYGNFILEFHSRLDKVHPQLVAILGCLDLC